jgi:hypothetical protein
MVDISYFYGDILFYLNHRIVYPHRGFFSDPSDLSDPSDQRRKRLKADAQAARLLATPRRSQTQRALREAAWGWGPWRGGVYYNGYNLIVISYWLILVNNICNNVYDCLRY